MGTQFSHFSAQTTHFGNRLLHHTEAVVIEGDSYRMRKETKQ